MNLQEFTSPLPKPWLNIHANSVETKKLDLVNQTSIVNPPIGSLSIYTDVTGALSSRDSIGTVVSYTTSADFADSLTQSGPTAQGNFPAYQDSVSNVVVDSGISANKINSIQSQSDSLAPAGLRDTWQIPPGLAFDGAFISYLPGPDILYSGAFPPQYSLDGGITFAPVVFDIPPPGASTTGIYYDGIGKWFTNSYSVLDPTYTSVDGINFVSSGIIPPGVPYSWQSLWVPRLNLWVSGYILGAGSAIATSPDGINWTQRATPVDMTGSFNGTSLMDTGDLLVLVGTGSIWSVDGINWNAGSGVSAYCQAACYSPDRKEFLATGGGTNELFQSNDGKTWVSLGLKGQYAVVSMIWVGGNIQHYYLNHPNDPVYGGSVANVYAIFSCADPLTQAFEATFMRGADSRNMAYSAVIYDASREHFVVGLNSVGVAYSTSRPLVPKAMNSGTAYASLVVSLTYAGIQVGADLFAPTKYSPNSRLIIPHGSLTIGDKYCLEFSAVVDTAAVGNSASFDLSSVNAGPLASFPLVAPVGGFTATPIIGKAIFTFIPSEKMSFQVTIGGFTPSGGSNIFQGFSFNTGGVAFNPQVDQILTFTYSTPDFTNMVLTDLLLTRIGSGAD